MIIIMLISPCTNEYVLREDKGFHLEAGYVAVAEVLAQLLHL